MKDPNNSPSSTIDYWAEANGGLRGSLMLKVSAVAYFVSGLLYFSIRLLVPDASGPDNHLFLTALVAWDITLFLLALAFLWTGINPIFSRMGLAVGGFAALQAVLLLLDMTTHLKMPFPPGILTLGRTLLLVCFALVERPFLGRLTTLVLATVAALQFIRVLLRGMQVWGPLPMPWENLMTAGFMVITAIAIFSVGRSLRHHEDRWAFANQPRRHAEFADFNNPLNRD